MPVLRILEGGRTTATMTSPPDLQTTTNARKRERGRIHCSVFGVYCHWCRQKTIEDHVNCSECCLRFCGLCLLNRHGENIRMEMMENVRWVCPKCRGGCGPGCQTNCCNCGPCRKAQHLPPTGQIIRAARNEGFNNVHDYLIHLETGESPAAIASRKQGRGWTSIDDSRVVAVVMEQRKNLEQCKNLAWANKRIRSLRFCLANSKWGSQSTSRQVQAYRLLLARSDVTWEIGRKVKSKCPQFQTQDHTFRLK